MENLKGISFTAPSFHQSNYAGNFQKELQLEWHLIQICQNVLFRKNSLNPNFIFGTNQVGVGMKMLFVDLFVVKTKRKNICEISLFVETKNLTKFSLKYLQSRLLRY